MSLKQVNKRKKEFLAMFPVAQDFHTGLWGWRRINGCLDLSCCNFKSEMACKQNRGKSHEIQVYAVMGKLCLSK